jgi:hypothetical protein
VRQLTKCLDGFLKGGKLPGSRGDCAIGAVAHAPRFASGLVLVCCFLLHDAGVWVSADVKEACRPASHPSLFLVMHHDFPGQALDVAAIQAAYPGAVLHGARDFCVLSTADWPPPPVVPAQPGRLGGSGTPATGFGPGLGSSAAGGTSSSRAAARAVAAVTASMDEDEDDEEDVLQVRRLWSAISLLTSAGRNVL